MTTEPLFYECSESSGEVTTVGWIEYSPPQPRAVHKRIPFLTFASYFSSKQKVQ